MNINTNWQLSLKKDSAEFSKERERYARLTQQFIQKWQNRTDYLENPELLREALNEYEKWEKEFGGFGDEGFYLHLATSLDQNNTDLKAKENEFHDFSIKNVNDIQFFSINIAKIPKEKQSLFLGAEILAPYKHYLEISFKFADHILTDAEEKILNEMGKMAKGNWIDMVSGFISKSEREIETANGGKETKSFSDIYNLLQSKNKKVRDSAALALSDIYKQHKDVAEREINTVLEYKKTTDKLRNYSRPDKSRHLGDDVDTEVVDTLVEVVTEAFDISKEYYKVKAKLLGVEKLAYHERNLDYGEIEVKYEFPEAYKIVEDVFASVDDEFVEIYRSMFANGQVDVFPVNGKYHGAFCTTGLHRHKNYILLNYGGKISDITTIAHEFGHAINYQLTKEHQNALNYGVPTSAAEVASTFFEDFALEHLINQMDDKNKLIILMNKLNDDISTIIRQIACYNFETDMHQAFRKEGYLSADRMAEIFTKNMVAYMGDAVEQDPGSENWWIGWPHIRNNFYVYSYAFGLLVSKALQAKVKEDRSYISSVKQFLSTGTSMSVKDTFNAIGIDISKKDLWVTGLSEVRGLLEEVKKIAGEL